MVEPVHTLGKVCAVMAIGASAEAEATLRRITHWFRYRSPRARMTNHSPPNEGGLVDPKREAKIVGKGNKERIVFFTDRALQWLRRYLEARGDDNAPLFVCMDGASRLKRPDIWRFFARVRRLAGISKPVRPHLLRHTAATRLLFNGCPIGHIKEILGHERLETTCRYYLGLDHRAAKQAHQRYLVYAPAELSELENCRPNPD